MSKNLLGRVLLNQYRIDSFIASGGMGAVYKVWDLKRNVPLAMKVLQNDLVDDPSAFKYFQREARALQRLAHPNIVPFYGLYQTEDLAFILEQFVDGPDLRDILRKQPNGMPIPEAMMYMKALCSALGYAHANEVVHCDIKPGNVMINSGGQIYLADFGIARHAQSTTTTIAGAGTPAYMAPEQIRGEQVTPATDVYELGILFFELLTGRRPFRGDEPESLAGGSTSGERIRYAHLNLQPVNPSRLNPGIPQALSAVILKALSKAPRGRYADAQSFYLAACQAIGRTPEAIPDHLPGQTGFPVASPTPTPTPAPAPRNTQPANAKGKYAMLVGGGVVLLLIVFMFVQKGGDPPPATPFVDVPTVVIPDNPTDAPPVVHSPQDPTSVVVSPTEVSLVALTLSSKPNPTIDRKALQSNALKNGCILGALWYSLESDNNGQHGDCLPLDSWGIISKDHGLTISLTNSAQTIRQGIYMPISGGTKISFKLVLSTLYTPYDDNLANISIGIISINSHDVESETLLIYQKESPTSGYPIFVKSRERNGYAAYLTQNGEYRKYTEFTPQEILLNLSETNQMTIFIDGSQVIKMTIPFQDTAFWIGYRLPEKGQINAEISDFKIQGK
ncbi:MAG: serine/threonine-protein kinase [Anaerolineales bacterium]